MIGKIISHYCVLEKLPSTGLRTGPSTEFIPSSSSGRRLSEVERLKTSPSTGLRTGCGGGNPAVAGQAFPTDWDKSSREYLLQEISE